MRVLRFDRLMDWIDCAGDTEGKESIVRNHRGCGMLRGRRQGCRCSGLSIGTKETESNGDHITHGWGIGCRRARLELLLLDRRRRRLDVGGEPLQTLEKTLAGGGTAGHNVPELVLEFVEFEGLGDLLWVHGYIGGEEEEEGVNIRFHMGS